MPRIVRLPSVSTAAAGPFGDVCDGLSNEDSPKEPRLDQASVYLDQSVPLPKTIPLLSAPRRPSGVRSTPPRGDVGLTGILYGRGTSLGENNDQVRWRRWQQVYEYQCGQFHVLTALEEDWNAGSEGHWFLSSSKDRRHVGSQVWRSVCGSRHSGAPILTGFLTRIMAKSI
jgi:hypothetical protein